MFFLSETLVCSGRIEEIRARLGFTSCFNVDCQGRSGGLAVFWSDTVQCVVTGYSQNFVDVEVMEERGGRWRLTLFYGFPETTRSRDCWTLLRSLASRSTLPWCVLGDINNLLHTSDKKGRFPPPSWLLNGFQNAIRDCNLIDMPLEGYPFTWCKSLGTPSAVEERLDRALATSEWFQVHPRARL